MLTLRFKEGRLGLRLLSVVSVAAPKVVAVKSVDVKDSVVRVEEEWAGAAIVMLMVASAVEGLFQNGVVSVILDGVTVLASAGFILARHAGGVMSGDARSSRSLIRPARFPIALLPPG